MRVFTVARAALPRPTELVEAVEADVVGAVALRVVQGDAGHVVGTLVAGAGAGAAVRVRDSQVVQRHVPGADGTGSNPGTCTDLWWNQNDCLSSGKPTV